MACGGGGGAAGVAPQARKSCGVEKCDFRAPRLAARSRSAGKFSSISGPPGTCTRSSLRCAAADAVRAARHGAALPVGSLTTSLGCAGSRSPTKRSTNALTRCGTRSSSTSCVAARATARPLRCMRCGQLIGGCAQGHTACLYMNKLHVAGLVDRINPEYESLFAVGVDEVCMRSHAGVAVYKGPWPAQMSWDDLLENKSDWPTVEQTKAFRQKVRPCTLSARRLHSRPLTRASLAALRSRRRSNA